MRMSQTLVAAIVTASVVVAAEAQAQTPAPPAGQDSQQKVVQGQVESIDPAGTGITLTDGTRLLTPPGRSLRPGALIEGMTVIASYREENGEKVMTELAIEKPPASPPTERLPATPPTEPLAHRGEAILVPSPRVGRRTCRPWQGGRAGRGGAAPSGHHGYPFERQSRKRV